MKLERVQLVDVRQFAGRQTIDLATSTSKKITLVHGPNTCGKTTLLNVIYWCFYGDFLPGFSEPGRLKSDQAEGDAFSVEVWFEHRGKRYVAKRGGVARPEQAGLVVLEQRANGQSVPHPQPELLIGSILPKPLAPFFFFAGEMILKGLSTGTYQQGATDAIRSVLGLKLAEQAIEDLKEIRKRKQKELQTLSAGTNLATVSAALAEAEQYVESRMDQLLQQRTLATQLETQKREIYDKLRGQESSSVLQQRRDRVEKQLSAAKSRLASADAERQRIVYETGHAVFLAQAAKDASAHINEGVTKKKVPSPFDKTFVKDILDSGICICERPISSSSKEYRAVAAMINSATDEVMMKRTLAVRAISERVATLAASAPRALRGVLERLSDGQDQLEQLEQEQARIRELMQRHEAMNVRELEAQVERVEDTLRDLVVNKKRTEDDIELKKADISRLKTELERAQAASPQVAQAKTGLDLVETLISSLQVELEAVETRGLERITAALNTVVGNSTRKKYSAEVTQEYAIRLYKSESDGEKRLVRVLSDGEQRLLDLCFVSALVAVCREREAEKNAIVLPGAIAPLVVDAPFGQLDPEYQALAVKTMMDLSDQLVLLLSKTHWTPEVDNAIRPSIGKEYLLIGYRQGSAGGAAPVRISVEDRVYDQMVYESPRDWTEVRPIGRPA